MKTVILWECFNGDGDGKFPSSQWANAFLHCVSLCSWSSLLVEIHFGLGFVLTHSFYSLPEWIPGFSHPSFLTKGRFLLHSSLKHHWASPRPIESSHDNLSKGQNVVSWGSMTLSTTILHTLEVTPAWFWCHQSDTIKLLAPSEVSGWLFHIPSPSLNWNVCFLNILFLQGANPPH